MTLLKYQEWQQMTFILLNFILLYSIFIKLGKSQYCFLILHFKTSFLGYFFYFHPQIMKCRMLSRIQKYSCDKFSIPIMYLLTTLLHNRIPKVPRKYKNHNCRMVTLRSVIMKRLEKNLIFVK